MDASFISEIDTFLKPSDFILKPEIYHYQTNKFLLINNDNTFDRFLLLFRIENNMIDWEQLLFRYQGIGIINISQHKTSQINWGNFKFDTFYKFNPREEIKIIVPNSDAQIVPDSQNSEISKESEKSTMSAKSETSGKSNRTRHFRVINPDGTDGMHISGRTPKSAAMRVLVFMKKNYTDVTKNQILSIKETTRGRKRKIYDYQATRIDIEH